MDEITDAERAELRKWCGKYSRFRQFDTEFEAAMSNLDNVPDDRAQVRLELSNCRSIDAQILKFVPSLSLADSTGGVKVGNGVRALGNLQRMGRMYSGRICGLLGVTYGPNDPWGQGGPSSSDLDRASGVAPSNIY